MTNTQAILNSHDLLISRELTHFCSPRVELFAHQELVVGSQVYVSWICNYLNYLLSQIMRCECKGKSCCFHNTRLNPLEVLGKQCYMFYC